MSQPASLPEAHPPDPGDAPGRLAVAVLILDPDGNVQAFRRRADALLDAGGDDCRGRSVEAVLPAPLGNWVAEAAEYAVAEGELVVSDLYHPRAQRWFTVRVQSTRDAVRVSFRDRTAQKQCGTLLHLLDADALGGLWRLTTEGTIQMANSAMARILGYDAPSELEGAGVERFLVNPARWPTLRAAHTEGTRLTCTLRRRDGTHVSGRMHLTPIRDATGQIQAFAGTVMSEHGAAVTAGRDELLERAVAATDDAVAVLEAGPLTAPGPKVAYVSPAFEELTGYPAAEAVGSSLRILHGPDTDTDVLRTLRAHLQREQPYRGEVVLYRRDGTPYVSQWSVAPVRDQKGTVRHWVVRQRDVTDRRSAESVLGGTDTEETGAALYTALDPLLRAQTVEEVGTAVVEVLADALSASRAVVRQAVEEELVPLATTEEARSAEGVALDSDHPAAQAWHSAGGVGGDAHLHLPLGRHGVLSVEHLAEGSVPVRLLDTLASHATAVLDRIATAATQRRAHERCEALRDAGRALLDAPSGPAGAEAVFEALAPVLPESVAARLLTFAPGDEQATVRAANPVALDGLERGDPWTIGSGLQRVGEGRLYAADDLGVAASTPLEQHLAEHGFRSLVGAPVVADEAYRGVLLLVAEPPEAFAPAHRTVAREAADLLSRTLDPPNDRGADGLKSAFLANIHHELRTPLTSIIGFAEVLGRTEGATDRFADLIARSGRRLEATFDNLLTLSRLEAGTMPVDPVPVSVAAEVRTVVGTFEDAAQDAGLALEWDGPEGPVDAVLDADGLHDVLRHLLDNAVAFTEDGGAVRVGLDEAGDVVTLTVADTGMGMDPARVPELFEPFGQASTGLNRSHEGCGLGLAIVEGWVGAMGGTVDVETTPEEGTTVVVRLPRMPGAGRL